MKARYCVMLALLLFVITSGYSQEESKKSKEARKLEKQDKTKKLVESKVFLFVGNRAYSEGGKSFTITSGPNTVSFDSELVRSNLPFFGQAKTASAGYGGQSGYTFEGKPDEYTVDSTKNGYKVKAVVKSGNDNFTMNLTISPEGSANLSVYSINRSSMRYNGEILGPEEVK